MGPKTLRFVPHRLLLAGLLTLFGFGALFTAATAQDEIEPDATAEAPVDDLATPSAEDGSDVDDGASDDASVAALPDTGSGSDEGSTAILLTGSALAAATLGLAAIGVRRVLMRTGA